MKQTKKKPPAKTKPAGTVKQQSRAAATARVSATEADRMFQVWVATLDSKGYHYETVAKQFKRSITTIRRVAERFNWKGRAVKVREQVEKKSDKLIVKAEMSNVHLAMQLRNKALEDFQNGLGKTPSVTDCVHAIDLCDRLGVGGEGETAGAFSGSADAIDAAERVVRELGAKGLKILGDWIVKSGLGDTIEREAAPSE